MSVWVASKIGPSNFGILNWSIAWNAIFAAISTLGLPSVSVRYFIELKDKKNNIVSSMFEFRFLISIFIFFISISTAFFFIHESEFDFSILVIISISQILYSSEVVEYLYRSENKWKIIFIIRLISFLIMNIVKCICIIYNFKLIYFALAILIESIIIAILYLIIYLARKDLTPKWVFDFNIIKKILKDSWPVIISSLSVILYMRIDQIMIGLLSNEKEVGIYSIAVRISESIRFLPVILAQISLPYIIKAKKKDIAKYNELHSRLLFFLFWICLIIVICILVFIKPFIELFFDSSYFGAISVLNVLVWSCISVAIGACNSQWFVSENLMKSELFRTTLGLILNFVLNFILIRSYGILGAAISSLISEFFVSVVSLLLTKKTRVRFYQIFTSIFSFKFLFRGVR